MFKLCSDYTPTGDQPEAIAQLTASIEKGNQNQTLLGVTGSGKTFTMANIIAKEQRPTLIISHNKTLAAQLYSEFKRFFPENAVEYFVSYYDYYQPEAYIPQTDTYIEKDSSINEDLDRLRMAATSALLTRKDVIVIASVSCIYGLGSPEDFLAMMVELKRGEMIQRNALLEQLVEALYERSDEELKRGSFRVRGEVVDIYPAYSETVIRVEFWGDTVDAIYEVDPESGGVGKQHERYLLYPANPYITPREKLERAMGAIKEELGERIGLLESEDRLVEAQRLKMRTDYDIEMLKEIGFCKGIENYSRHIDGREPGSRPKCLIDFFPKDALLMIDESHVTVPQIRGMYLGDRARKLRLVEYGFRLPSAVDNRPLKPEEFEELAPQTLYVSATPGPYELEHSETVAEQVIRPTGLLDPSIEIRPIEGQVQDLIGEIYKAVSEKTRVLVTTLTKRMSEELTAYMEETDIRVEYIHSDIDAIERVEILRRLRQGLCDVLVGVNLLREGLDLPEVALVAVLDADKEGFLRSRTSLVQTAGRAARHEKGRVIFYADVMTDSIKATLDETQRRRQKQIAYNKERGITPRSVKREIDSLAPHGRSVKSEGKPGAYIREEHMEAIGDIDMAIAQLENEMLKASNELKFEKAAVLRDQIQQLKKSTINKEE